MKNSKPEDDYRELGLAPGASLEEVKNSYRELALLWHPDRRTDGHGQGSRAHQKMTRINLAYERLRKALQGKAASKSAVEPAPARRAQGAPSQDEHGASAGRPRSQEMRTNSL